MHERPVVCKIARVDCNLVRQVHWADAARPVRCPESHRAQAARHAARRWGVRCMGMCELLLLSLRARRGEAEVGGASDRPGAAGDAAQFLPGVLH